MHYSFDYDGLSFQKRRKPTGMNKEVIIGQTSDGFADESKSAFNNTTVITVGEISGSDVNGWTVFDISPRNGNIIHACILKLTASQDSEINVSIQIAARSLATANPPTNYADYLTKKVTNITSAVVNVDLSPIPFVQNTQYNIANIKSVIQEVLDNNPTFDGTIEIWLFNVNSNGTRSFRAGEDTYREPSLTIYWM